MPGRGGSVLRSRRFEPSGDFCISWCQEGGTGRRFRLVRTSIRRGRRSVTVVHRTRLCLLCRSESGDSRRDRTVLRIGPTRTSFPFSMLAVAQGTTDRFLLPRVGTSLQASTFLRRCSPKQGLTCLMRSTSWYDGEKLPFPDETFDVVLAICVLHHVPVSQRYTFVSEMVRVARSGGVVAIFEHNPFNPLTRHAVNSCQSRSGCDPTSHPADDGVAEGSRQGAPASTSLPVYSDRRWLSAARLTDISRPPPARRTVRRVGATSTRDRVDGRTLASLATPVVRRTAHYR